MHASNSLLVLVLIVFANLVICAQASDLRAVRSSLEARYARAHSLGNNYHFSARDGWQTVNVTNLQYKYRRDLTGDEAEDEGEGDTDRFDDLDLRELYARDEDDHFGLAKRARKNVTFNPMSKSKLKAKSGSKTSASKSSKKGSIKTSGKTSKKPATKTSKTPSLSKGGITSSVKSILASLRGQGKTEPVTITWYTGHDLENPSCWPNPVWAPTDAAFACALTLEGWTTRPKCFKFLELCNTPKKCVFVRVVDSCAGCKKGSKHVDLTQAAFKELATLDQGLLQVQMRQATDPDGWLENLWGPKA